MPELPDIVVYAECLERRIRGRAHITEDELAARLDTAREEMKVRDRYDRIITNADLDAAYTELEAAIAERRAARA